MFSHQPFPAGTLTKSQVNNFSLHPSLVVCFYYDILIELLMAVEILVGSC